MQGGDGEVWDRNGLECVGSVDAKEGFGQASVQRVGFFFLILPQKYALLYPIKKQKREKERERYLPGADIFFIHIPLPPLPPTF